MKHVTIYPEIPKESNLYHWERHLGKREGVILAILILKRKSAFQFWLLYRVPGSVDLIIKRSVIMDAVCAAPFSFKEFVYVEPSIKSVGWNRRKYRQRRASNL
ncbi:MAG: hypothetical protein ACYCUV_07845 [Phycisphaerae bacterium]